MELPVGTIIQINDTEYLVNNDGLDIIKDLSKKFNEELIILEEKEF